MRLRRARWLSGLALVTGIAISNQPVLAKQGEAPIEITSFSGAYLAARLAGLDPVEATRCAHRVAASVVEVRGALAPFETLTRAFSS